MKKFLALLFFVGLSVNTVLAFDVQPSSVTMDIELNESKSIIVTLLSDLADSIYDEITFSGAYLMSYVPVGTVLDPGSPKNFTLNVGGIQSYERSPNQLNATTVLLQDDIVIKGFNDSGLQELGVLHLNLNLHLPAVEDEREYTFKRCFVENNEEFCSAINISDYENVTVQNVTVENVSYAVSMPYDLVTQYLERYNEKFDTVASSVVDAAQAIVLSVNETIELQNRQDNRFSNALLIENYLKNANNPSWVEISPDKSFITLTGLSNESFIEALQILFEDGKVTQKTEIETETVQTGGGLLNRQVTKAYVASTERLELEGTRSSNQTTIFLVVSILLAAGLFAFIYFRFFKRRTKF